MHQSNSIQQSVKQELQFISLLRIFSALLIFTCHAVQISHDAFIIKTANFFSIGVQIFFSLSALCFGLHGDIENPLKWYGKRIKRTFVPYEIFVLSLFIISSIKGRIYTSADWIKLIFGVQGSHIDILGAEHTWYISSLLICYLFTPLISLAYGKFCTAAKPQKVLFAVFWAALFILSSFLLECIFIIVAPLFFYLIAYFCGRNYSRVKLNKHTLITSAVCLLFFAAIRVLLSLSLALPNQIYNLLIQISTFGIAISFIFLCAVIFKSFKSHKIIKYFSSISFEFYLYHMMFIFGPAYIHLFESSWFLTVFVKFIVSIVVSALMNYIGKLLYMLINKFLRKDMKNKWIL